ncbi:hypothetical protein PP629_gp43 [Streptomyces phage Dubu]|uniref:Uncharacterized protein n=1 Tax=Streptomyces phage Dubu TaxID=2591226 RepID=A0A514DEW8_9CAUD|nr:hypothetical protein PP629_gp43 [Streptomyces phage Dubu]QDH92148.1 hypothetical protein SEA_DUBU_43 [Streptomyces phage Dubu]
MTASRATHFVHEDGTVSTRNSKTRVYAWAVEVKTDQHAEAIAAKYRAKEMARDAQSFERAVATGKTLRKSKSWSQGQTYQDFYAVDPETGAEHWLGAQVVDGQGQVVRESFDRAAEIERKRADQDRAITRKLEEAQELADGPRYRYGIIRWSERRDSAEKALASFRYEHATYRVVEAQEGKAPAAPAPVAEEPQEAAADSTEAATPAAPAVQEPKLTEAQEKALVWAHNLAARDLHLVNGIGARLATVRKLEALGLVTLDAGWDRPWSEGMRPAKPVEYVWLAKLTDAGRALAARLAGEPQEAAQEPQEEPEAAEVQEAPEERHTVTLEHVLARPGEMVTRAWVHVASQADHVDFVEWPGVLNVFDADVAQRLEDRGWRRTGELEYLAGPNAYRGPVRRL